MWGRPATPPPAAAPAPAPTASATPAAPSSTAPAEPVTESTATDAAPAPSRRARSSRRPADTVVSATPTAVPPTVTDSTPTSSPTAPVPSATPTTPTASTGRTSRRAARVARASTGEQNVVAVPGPKPAVEDRPGASKPEAAAAVPEPVVETGPVDTVIAVTTSTSPVTVSPTSVAAPAEPVEQVAQAESIVAPSPVAAAAPIDEAQQDQQAQIRARRARRAAGRGAAAPIVPEPIPMPAASTSEEPVVEPTPAAASVDSPIQPVMTPAEPFELLEPVVAPEPQPTPAPAAERRIEDELDDVFEVAARVFSFTGETPVQPKVEPKAEQAESDEAPKAASSDDHVAPRRTRPTSRTTIKRIAGLSFSIGVMGVVGLMTVGMTTPAEAVAAMNGSVPEPLSVVAGSEVAEAELDDDQVQAYVAPAELEAVALDRPDDDYSTMTLAELASESGIRNFSNFFVNDPNSPIQWPFAVGVPISYGFGMRSGRMHEGVDFTPGAGSPIQAIADGVVRESTDAGGAYGVHVIIDHVIDGQLVSSHYAHMQYGSRRVQAGQHVTVGTVLGLTGNTGRSYGAHTHFEILLNGTTAIDPIPWLRQHAGG